MAVIAIALAWIVCIARAQSGWFTSAVADSTTEEKSALSAVANAILIRDPLAASNNAASDSVNSAASSNASIG